MNGYSLRQWTGCTGQNEVNDIKMIFAKSQSECAAECDFYDDCVSFEVMADAGCLGFCVEYECRLSDSCVESEFTDSSPDVTAFATTCVWLKERT